MMIKKKLFTDSDNVSKIYFFFYLYTTFIYIKRKIFVHKEKVNRISHNAVIIK